ncbi:MAG: hypothetical protein K2X87_18055 [Gemmataceae bacterium]|nr:hypothetical protein [Gemmataceae bacterium]
MTFTVYWRPPAEAQAEAIWVGLGRPDDFVGLLDDVNRLLRDSAHEQGESRDRATRRIWFPRPLVVFYQIDEVARVVYVEDVRWVGE